METYYFLFALAFIYTIFASVQDLRKREVANWLNFSLIGFVLAYRLFYSAYTNNYQFFILGVLGFAVFYALSTAFYYTKVFAGGDAKLLMGFGAILPYQNYWDLLFLSLVFVFVLFFVGTIYSLLFSISLAIKNKSRFKKEFREQLKRKKHFFILSLAGIGIIVIEAFALGAYISSWWFFALLFIFMPFLYIYLEAVNNSCMIKLISAFELTEGDWLEQNVRIGSKVIKKSVHGVSLNEIEMLRKAKKKILVRYGVPFVPAFLIALVIMVFFFAVLKVDFQSFLASLF